jgi:hypothetical protein
MNNINTLQDSRAGTRPEPDTTAVIALRTLDDLALTSDRREGLAMRGPWALENQLDELGKPTAMTAPEVYDLVERVLAAVLLDEPGTGGAVDIAGAQFGSAFRAHATAFVLAGPANG